MTGKSRHPGEGDDSEVHRQSGPSESNKVAYLAQKPDIIDISCAPEPDGVRAIRRSIQRGAAYSASRAKRAICGDARELFWTASQIGASWTFRAAGQESLRSARDALRHLYEAAAILEDLETPADEPGDEPGRAA